MLPRGVAVQRIARNVEGDILGQHDPKLLLGHRNDAADLAVDDRDGRSPIALARHAPVAQPPDGGALAPAFGFGAGAHRLFRVVDRKPVEATGINEPPAAGIGLVPARGLGTLAPRPHPTARTPDSWGALK